MFENQIQQAYEMVKRLESGFDVRIEEYIAWYDAIRYGLKQEFGENSAELKRWDKIYEDDSEELRKGIGDSSSRGYAVRIRKYSGLLQEFNAIIGMKNSKKPDSVSPVSLTSIISNPPPSLHFNQRNYLFRIYVVVIVLILIETVFTYSIEEWFLFGINMILLLLMGIAWRLST